MSFTTNKSDIAEVRDQLSLDFADEEYLSIIGQNLGIHKHLFSFDDDIWRALVKTLAIEYKQVVTKFNDVLEILFGPKVTEVGTMVAVWDESQDPWDLLPSAIVGDTTFFMNDTSTLPQIGTLLFDEGLATEETLEYRFIDRRYNEVVLRTPFAFDHFGRDRDAEEFVLSISSSGEVVCSRTGTFPTTDYSYTVILDRGLPTEATYTVTANDTGTDTLTVTPSPFDLHASLYPTNIFGELLQDYFPEATLITLESSLQFPESGVIRLEPTLPFAANADGAAQSDKTVDVAASTFVADTLGGYEVVFSGNTTAKLAGVKRRIISNGTNIITLDKDFTDLTPASVFPHNTDTFTIYPVVGYSSNDHDTNSLTLHKTIPSALSIDKDINSRVELLDGLPKVSLAPVQFVGSGWDIIQSTPRLVELYIPESIRGVNDLRSASYLHDDTIVTAATSTLTGALIAGDTQLNIVTEPDFPDSGILIIDEGNAEEELVAYGRILSSLKEDSLIGAGTLTLVNSNAFPSSGSIVLNQGGATEETHVISANEKETGVLTLLGTLSDSHYAGEVVRHINVLNAQSGVVNAHAISDDVTYYYPEYASSLPIGDYHVEDGVHPGPYIYSIFDRAPSSSDSSVVIVTYGGYRYDSTTTTGPPSGDVRFNDDNLAAPTASPFRCKIADINLIAQNNSEKLEALQVNDWVRLYSVAQEKEMLVQVGGNLTDNTTFWAFDAVNTSFSNPLSIAPLTRFADVDTITITSWTPGAGHNLATISPGPTLLSMDQFSGNTCIEVESALAMQESTSLDFPFEVTLGRDTLLVSAISIASRVATTVAAPGTSIGDKSMIVAALDIGNTDGEGFPAGVGYRVIIDEGNSSQEVAWVNLVDESTKTLYFDAPLFKAHLTGVTVALMKDVLSTDELILGHKGLTHSDQRSTSLEEFSSILPTEEYNERTTGVVRPKIDCIEVTDSAGLSTNDSTILLNFGSGALLVEDSFASYAALTVTLSDASSFPATFPYIIEIAPGSRTSEAFVVTGKSGNDLTVSYAPRYTHTAGDVVRFTPGQYEVLQYQDLDGNELCFSPTLMLEYTHYPLETIVPSYGYSDPRDDGFSFPLRLPFDLASRLRFILDLIRAAGVEVEIISER